MTAPRDRAWMLDQIAELGKAYDALTDTNNVARGTARLHGRTKGEPPIPIRPVVVALQEEIEREVLRLLSSARIRLGWYLPPVRLARDGEWLPCPDCDVNSLWIDRQAWAVFCILCRRRWAWGHEVDRLGEIVKARALDAAQAVANELGETA